MKKRILTLMGLALVLALCLLAGCASHEPAGADTPMPEPQKRRPRSNFFSEMALPTAKPTL